MSWAAPGSISNLTGYPGDLKFPGRCDRFYTNFSLQVGHQDLPRFAIWCINRLTYLFVTRMEVPPLASDLFWGAGEEANSPAGGARGDGGVRGCEGSIFINIKIVISSILTFSEA